MLFVWVRGPQVTTVVRGSPRRCLELLTAYGGTTTLLGPATRQEVLQRRHADDEREVGLGWGAAGWLARRGDAAPAA